MLDYKDRYNLLCEDIAEELFNKNIYGLTDDEEKQVFEKADDKMADCEAQLIDDAMELTYEQEDHIIESGLEKWRENKK